MADVKAIPEGFVGVTPHIVVKGAAKALEFYEKALGAEVVAKMEMPGTDFLMHAEISLGGARMMIADYSPDWPVREPVELGGSPVVLHLYVEDVDAVLAQAVEHGATVTMPADDMFWGDRYAKFTDPFGHEWSLATHISDPTEEEMAAAFQAMSSGE